VWGWGYIEADFIRYYNIDILYFYKNDSITWRRFLILIKGLPADSAFKEFIRDKKKRSFVEYDGL
jgi:hypothetical protein